MLSSRLAGIKNANYYADDEYHTIQLSLKSLVSGETENFRVSEFPRIVAKALIPYGILKMNLVLGGDHFTEGWQNNGFIYLQKNYPNAGQFKNPSVQDFFISMRSALVLIVFISFLPLIAELYLRRMHFVIFLICLSAGMSHLLYFEQMIFYVEPIQLTVFNLLLFHYLRVMRLGFVGLNDVILSSVLVGVCLSCKMSGLFAILIPASYMLWFYFNDYRSLARFLTIYIIGIISVYLICNYTVFFSSDRTAYLRFLQDNLSNFWHYAVGHEKMDQSGISHSIFLFNALKSTFGYLLYLMPIACLAGLVYASPGDRIVIMTVGLCLLFSFLSISAQNLYLNRNALPWIVMISCVLGISLHNIMEKFISSGFFYARYLFYALAVILLLGGAYSHVGPAYFDKIHYSNSSLVRTYLKSKIESGSIQKIVSFDYALEDKFFGVGIVNQKMPSLSHNNFKIYEAQIKSSVDLHTAFVVNRRGPNFQLTNYILPKLFENYVRIGDCFIFYN